MRWDGFEVRDLHNSSSICQHTRKTYSILSSWKHLKHSHSIGNYHPRLARSSKVSFVVSSLVWNLIPRIRCSFDLSYEMWMTLSRSRMSGYPKESWCDGIGDGVIEFAAATVLMVFISRLNVNLAHKLTPLLPNISSCRVFNTWVNLRTKFELPSVVMIRSPPASAFSNANTCASAVSRTSTQELESDRASLLLIVPATTWLYQICKDVLRVVTDFTSWMGGCTNSQQIVWGAIKRNLPQRPINRQRTRVVSSVRDSAMSTENLTKGGFMTARSHWTSLLCFS